MMSITRPLINKLWSLALAIFLVGGVLDAASLHTIIICDTLANNIGESVEADFNRVRAEMHRIAYYTKLNLRETLFIENEVDTKILATLKNYSIEKEDIVFLFFSGHGYRTESKKDNVWPMLYFTSEGKGVDFYKLTEVLQAKRPKFFIAIADCCNNVLPEAYAPPLIKGEIEFLNARKPRIKSNYEKLFLQSRGSIISSSSAPGEYSWASRSGGLFTMALFDSLTHEIHAATPGWETLFSRASATILERDNLGQTPQYQLSIK